MEQSLKNDLLIFWMYLHGVHNGGVLHNILNNRYIPRQADLCIFSSNSIGRFIIFPLFSVAFHNSFFMCYLSYHVLPLHKRLSDDYSTCLSML